MTEETKIQNQTYRIAKGFFFDKIDAIVCTDTQGKEFGSSKVSNMQKYV